MIRSRLASLAILLVAIFGSSCVQAPRPAAPAAPAASGATIALADEDLEDFEDFAAWDDEESDGADGAIAVSVPFLGAATYDVVLKGTSETFAGEKFPFTGVGTMTIDEGNGLLSFNLQLSNGLGFTGDGQAAVTERGRVFASVDLESGSSSIFGLPLGAIEGVAVVDGKTKRDRSSFSVKMTAAIPNRQGPPPQGFVLSKISAKGTRRVVS
jgi:hypothetical protein